MVSYAAGVVGYGRLTEIYASAVKIDSELIKLPPGYGKNQCSIHRGYANGSCLIQESPLCDGIGGAQWRSPLEGPDGSKQSNTENVFRSKPFLKAQGKEAPSHDDGVSIGGTPNLERKPPALDPDSYLNPRKRALEQVRGIGDIFSLDSSAKQEQPGGPGNEWNTHAISHTSSTDPQSAGSHDDFQSLVGQSYREESSLDPNARPLENASRNARLVQRMPATDQRPVRARLQGSVGSQTIGQIVEVEGGHIVRSTARKDRHSKVCTAKGLRDRRVRLSALTAIQFYDVQDRLGFDRPSKAVDWLIKKARASIDELAPLPPWESYQLHSNPAARFGHEAGTSANLSSPDEQRDAGEAQLSEPTKDKHQAMVARPDSRAIARERARERAKERLHERDAAERALENHNHTNATTASFHFGHHHHHQYYFTSNNSGSLQQNASNSFPSGQGPFHVPLQAEPQRYNMPESSSRRKQDVPSYLQQQHQAFSTGSRLEPMAAYSAYGTTAADPTTNIVHQAGLFSNSGTDQGSSGNQNMYCGSADVGLADHHHQPLQILSAPWNATDLLALNPPPPNLYNISTGSALNVLRGHNSFTVRGTLQSISAPVCVRHSPLLLHQNRDQENELQTAASFASDGISSFRIPARIQGLDEHADVKPSATSSSDRL